MRIKTITLGFTTMVFLSLVLAACGGTSTSAPAATGGTGGKLTTLTLALDWVPNTNHTGIYVAMQKGWYKEEGLDLQILPYADGASPETLVANGKADLGIAGGEGAITAVAAGQPLVSIAAIIQKDTSAFVTRKDSGIASPKQFEGKRYAGFGAAYEEPVIAAMMKADGSTSTKFQNVTTNVFGFEAVAGKQADIVWIFMGWDGVQAQMQNIELNIIPPTKYGIPDRPTPIIITNTANTTAKADALKKFGKATARGYDFAIANPKEAADLLIAGAPKGTFSNTDLVYKSQEYLSPRYKEGADKWGVQNLKAWTDFPKFMYDNKLLLDSAGKPITKELDYGKLFSNEFLPK
jgi:ABC-type nitrate/sulfonate/bicarbonate transport system substrate-binding protein